MQNNSYQGDTEGFGVQENELNDLRAQLEALNSKFDTAQELFFAHQHTGIDGAQVNWFDIEEFPASRPSPATTGTVSIQMDARVVTVTPTGSITYNAQGGTPGFILTFYVTTSGTTSYTITFGTNFRTTGTLATGTTSGKAFTVTFVCIDGTVWSEISRTAVQA